jgi:hypothetical protein
MRKHEVMVADEWHYNGPQDLVTVSLSVANAWPYHNAIEGEHLPTEVG